MNKPPIKREFLGLTLKSQIKELRTHCSTGVWSVLKRQQYPTIAELLYESDREIILNNLRHGHPLTTVIRFLAELAEHFGITRKTIAQERLTLEDSVFLLDMPSPTAVHLANSKMTIIRHVLTRSEAELLHVPSLGRGKVDEVKQALAMHGWSLRVDPQDQEDIKQKTGQLLAELFELCNRLDLMCGVTNWKNRWRIHVDELGFDIANDQFIATMPQVFSHIRQNKGQK